MWNDKIILTDPGVAQVLCPGCGGHAAVERVGVTLAIRPERLEKEPIAGRGSEHLLHLWEMGPALYKIVIEVHEERADALSPVLLKFTAPIRVFTARVVMGPVKCTGRVPHDLQVLAIFNGRSG
jgi:hypothetical protein